MKIFCFFSFTIQKDYVFSVIRFSKNHRLKMRAELSKLNRKLRFLLFQRCLLSLVFLLRKEVIHPHVPVGIPCYDLTPIIDPTFDGSLPLLG